MGVLNTMGYAEGGKERDYFYEGLMSGEAIGKMDPAMGKNVLLAAR